MRSLLRAEPRLDLYGEFSTLAEGFVDAGGEAQLRTRHPARAWALARRSGSSRPDRLVQAAEAGRRWLPRERLGAYLRTLQAEDRERLSLLIRPPEAA